MWHQEVGPLACNCYLVAAPGSNEAILIDPGGDASEIERVIEEKGLEVTAIVATHAHFDHVVAAEELRRSTGAPFYLHPGDNVLLDWFQESGRMFLGLELGAPPDVDAAAGEGERLRAGALELEVLHTPGHSPGSISLIAPDRIFSGDTLFAGSVGRTDLPGGDTDALVRAVRTKLFAFDEDTAFHPGHGPSTTLGREKRSNPFVGVSSGLWTP